MWHNMNGFGFMGFGGWVIGIFWLVVLALIVWLIVAFARSKNIKNSVDTREGSTGIRILEERYARGELDREEYMQKKHDLTS